MGGIAFTIRSRGQLVNSGSENFWSDWGVSLVGGILWVALPLLLHPVALWSVVTFWFAGSCHLSLLKFYLRQPLDHDLALHCKA